MNKAWIFWSSSRVFLSSLLLPSLSNKGTTHLQRPRQRVAEVLDDLVDADAAHCPHRQRPHERVRVLRVLDERVDGHDREVGLRLGVVDQVEVDQLLELEVVGLRAVGDVGEEHRDVLADSHRRDDLLDGLLGAGAVRGAEVLFQLGDLAC